MICLISDKIHANVAVSKQHDSSQTDYRAQIKL